MKKITVITDSDSSLPVDLAAQHGILQVPILIEFGGDTFKAGIDIDDYQLFEKVDRLKKLPTTSAPAPFAFQSAYEKAFRDGADGIIVICVSSKISATYAAAVKASEAFPGRDITVIDSLSVSMGQAFMAIATAEALAQGAKQAEAVAKVEEIQNRIVFYAVLPTLKYLAMSGRVGKLVAGMADTLNIKPILTMQDGKIVLLERVRTRTKAVERMLELVYTSLNGYPIDRAAIIHACNPEGAEELKKILCAGVGCPPEVIVADFTPGLSVHTGSGMVGLVVIPRR